MLDGEGAPIDLDTVGELVAQSEIDFRVLKANIRAVLRERCDPSIEKDAWRLSVLVKWRDRIYYRWTNSESFADMADVMFFLAESSLAGAGGEPSGRFDRIFVKEIDSGKLVTI